MRLRIRLEKLRENAGYMMLVFRQSGIRLGARCAENNMKVKVLGEIMGRLNVEIYYSVRKTAEESPLEFLREAYFIKVK